MKTHALGHLPQVAVQTPLPTVFLVDDDVPFLRSMSRVLVASGFQVVMHNSAAEFLQMLKPGTAGCVVSDLKMPGMDGMALQEALHKADSPLIWHRPNPAILYTPA